MSSKTCGVDPENKTNIYSLSAAWLKMWSVYSSAVYIRWSSCLGSFLAGIQSPKTTSGMVPVIHGDWLFNLPQMLHICFSCHNLFPGSWILRWPGSEPLLNKYSRVFLKYLKNGFPHNYYLFSLKNPVLKKITVQYLNTDNWCLLKKWHDLWYAQQVQFGHAGASANAESETAVAKNIALRAAGALVPNSFNDLGETIKYVLEICSNEK